MRARRRDLVSCLKVPASSNRINRTVHFRFYRSDAAQITDATESIRAAGARVIAAKPGLALIETTDAVAAQLSDMLRDWKVTKEINSEIPKLRPKLPPTNDEVLSNHSVG